jgi:hypothetical protein
VQQKAGLRSQKFLLVARATHYENVQFFASSDVGAPLQVVSTATPAQAAAVLAEGMARVFPLFLEPTDKVPQKQPASEINRELLCYLSSRTAEGDSDAERLVGCLYPSFSSGTADGTLPSPHDQGALRIPDGIPDFGTVAEMFELVEKGTGSCSALIDFDSEDAATKVAILASLKSKWKGKALETNRTKVMRTYAIYSLSVLTKKNLDTHVTNKQKLYNDACIALGEGASAEVPIEWMAAKKDKSWHSVALLARAKRVSDAAVAAADSAAAVE